MSGLTTSESNNIYSPPGNSLAVFLDKNGTLQLKDINGKTVPLSNYISEIGTYIKITRAEAVTLKSTSSFVPGSIYVITNADVSLYGGTEITLTAISSDRLSLQGSGLFYCPKYDVSAENNGYGIWTTYMNGTFSNILGTFTKGEIVTAQNGATASYLAQGFLNYISGDWSEAIEIGGATGTCEVSGFVSPSYNIGEIVHWGGKSWINVGGTVGVSVNKYELDTSHWQEIPFNSTDYNIYVDEIQYDFDNDMIIYRKDRYNNIVSGSNQIFIEFTDPEALDFGNPIKDFQWGCSQDDFNTTDYFEIGFYGNNVTDSYFETLNSIAYRVSFNSLSEKSYIKNLTLDVFSVLNRNSFNSKSVLQGLNLADSTIDGNNFSEESSLVNIIFSVNELNKNTFNSQSRITSTELINSDFSFNSFSCFTELTNLTANTKIIKYNNFSNLTEISNSDLPDIKTTNFQRCLINGVDFSSATIIQNEALAKNIYNRLDGTPRLQYLNDSDVIVITDVNA